MYHLFHSGACTWEGVLSAADDLHHAVRDLLESKRHRIIRDSGKRQHVKVTSLWEQLVDAVATGKEATMGGAFTGRPPASIDVLDLRSEIMEVTVDALQGHDQTPRVELQTWR